MNRSVDPTQRFSSRVENYVRFRPYYPAGVIHCLQHNCGLTSTAVIADVSSGTGLLTTLFLDNGNTVYGVEPNREMREVGERFLAHDLNFKSINATAEKTTLPSNSIEFVVAGQAFHWFDPEKTNTEFKRILRASGWVALIWNERREGGTPFARGYERLLQTFAPNYAQVNHKQIADASSIARFFGGQFGRESFPHSQSFDFEGLQGRLLSSSYAPEAEDPQQAPMLEELQRLFDAFQENGCVSFEYDTQIYFGHLL